VLKLAPLLGVDVDFLMRHYVVELYTSGLDKIAQEVESVSANNLYQLPCSVGRHVAVGLVAQYSLSF